MRRSIPTALAVGCVLAVYVFFGSGASLQFWRHPTSHHSYYASLTEGFLNGHLYLQRDPDPRLFFLPDPYNPAAREGIFYLWDASYYQGRYYLYFSPLPVFLWYLPFRLLTGDYPTDPLAATFFCAWAFIASVLFIRRALMLSGREPVIPVAGWVLLIGVGNIVTYVLTSVATYEVAIASGAAMTAMWAVALLRFVERPTLRSTAWVSIWLALAIAARPNLAVLVAVAAAAVLSQLRRSGTWKTAVAFAAPLAVVAALMISYNIARFGRPLEFGISYQLSSVSMQGCRICGLRGPQELGRFANNLIHYAFWPPVIHNEFPFVDAVHAKLDRDVSWPTPRGLTEQIVGIAALVPLTLPGVLLALAFVGFPKNTLGPGTSAAMHVAAGGGLVVLALSTCWWIVARYALDFTFLLVAGSIVCIETAIARIADAGIGVGLLRVAILFLIAWSVGLGFLLGFAGPGDAFERLHPATFREIVDFLE